MTPLVFEIFVLTSFVGVAIYFYHVSFNIIDTKSYNMLLTSFNELQWQIKFLNNFIKDRKNCVLNDVDFEAINIYSNIINFYINDVQKKLKALKQN